MSKKCDRQQQFEARHKIYNASCSSPIISYFFPPCDLYHPRLVRIAVFQDHRGLSKISLNPSATLHHLQGHMGLITFLKGTKVEIRRRQQKPVSTSLSEALYLLYGALAPHLFTATAAVHPLYMAM